MVAFLHQEGAVSVFLLLAHKNCKFRAKWYLFGNVRFYSFVRTQLSNMRATDSRFSSYSSRCCQKRRLAIEDRSRPVPTVDWEMYILKPS
jgi:hypothetical protein